jgi:hypothetical protein
VLKEHMRKKQHKRLNPENHAYDKFYLVNYLEFGKTWHDIETEDDEGCDEHDESESWDDWKEEKAEICRKAQKLEEVISRGIVCLFCREKRESSDELFSHMKETHHGFDFEALAVDGKLDFYDKVKMVNFYRRAVRTENSITCSNQRNY